MTWTARFSEPILLSDGAELATLQDAGAYIMRLPKPVHDSAPWQSAMHVLLQAADHGGPVEFARLGMMQALFPIAPRIDPSRKDPVWHRRRA